MSAVLAPGNSVVVCSFAGFRCHCLRPLQPSPPKSQTVTPLQPRNVTTLHGPAQEYMTQALLLL